MTQGFFSSRTYPIGGYAPGSYCCTCCTCGTQFTGDKMAVQCELCAIRGSAEYSWHPAEEETPYDKFYLCALKLPQICGTVWEYIRTRENRMNQWRLEDGEILVGWMHLPPMPNSEQNDERSVATESK